MKIIVLCLCMFFILTTPAYSMFRNNMIRNGISYSYDHNVVRDEVHSVQHNAKPEDQAKFLLDEEENNPKPYIHYALKYSKALNAFINAGASINDQIGSEYPLDTALRTDALDGIATLITHPKINFDTTIKCQPVSLGFANPNTILHFSNIYYNNAPDPDRAMELTTQITQYCSAKTIDEYLKQGGQLYLPPYQHMYKTLSIEHPIFYIKPLMHYARTVRQHYSSSTREQQTAYENAVKCALLALVAAQHENYELFPPSVFLPHYLATLYSDCAYKILQYHPMATTTNTDLSLAWDIMALALDGNNETLVANMKTDLEHERKPLPDHTFLSQLLAYCIHKRRRPETLQLCLAELAACKNQSPRQRQTPLLVLLHDKKNKSSLATTSIQDAATETGDPEILALLKKSGFALNRAQLQSYLSRYTTAGTTNLQKIYALLRTYPTFKPDTPTADSIANIIEPYASENIDPRITYIEEHTWQYTSSPHYPFRKLSNSLNNFLSDDATQ